jgi:hypothetical protein
VEIAPVMPTTMALEKFRKRFGTVTGVPNPIGEDLVRALKSAAALSTVVSLEALLSSLEHLNSELDRCKDYAELNPYYVNFYLQNSTRDAVLDTWVTYRSTLLKHYQTAVERYASVSTALADLAVGRGRYRRTPAFQALAFRVKNDFQHMNKAVELMQARHQDGFELERTVRREVQLQGSTEGAAVP